MVFIATAGLSVLVGAAASLGRGAAGGGTPARNAWAIGNLTRPDGTPIGAIAARYERS